MLARFAFHSWIASIAVALVSAPASPAAADMAAHQGLGRHFVLLIDDSGDMDRLGRQSRTEVASLLFAEGDERSVGWPAFLPGRDHLSVLFFAIHTDGPAGECKEHREFSALPRAIFQQVSFDSGVPQSAEDFLRSLDAWLDLPCRRGGKFSPMVTAPSLSLLPAARDVGPEDRFAETIIVQVTNDKFNHSVSAARELWVYETSEDGRGLRDVRRAEELAEQVISNFRVDTPPGWMHRVETRLGNFFVRGYRVSPLAPSPRALTWIPAVQSLDRYAVSPERIEWKAEEPEGGRLMLLSSAGMSPERLVWRAHDGDGEPWHLAGHPVAIQLRSVSIADCVACRSDGDVTTVDFLELLDLPEIGPKDPVSAVKGYVDLRVVYHFDPEGEYDVLHPSTPVQTVELRPSPARGLGATFLEPETLVTNAQLARLWRPADGELGMSQSTALERLVQERDRRRLVQALGALAAGALFVFVLFKTAYHRRFRPILDWRAAGPISLDLSQAGASRLLVGTVGVENRGHQPWFGRLLGHDEQPTRESDLELSPFDLESSGFEVRDRERNAVGFLRSESGLPAEEEAEGLDEVGDGESLSKEGSKESDEIVPTIRRSVSHGQRVPVFVATESLADFGSTSGAAEETSVRLESTARMKSRRSRRRDEAVETPASFEVRVLPEVATPPRVRFEPLQERLEYREGEALEVGTFVFESLANHRFAVPFESEYDLEVLRDRTPLGGPALRLAESRVVVQSGERRRVAVLLDCDGELVRNPDPIRQTYTLELLGPCHRESKRGPHEVVLYRDSTRAEAEVRLSYLGKEWDLFQDGEGEVTVFCEESGRSLHPSDGVLMLEEDFPFRIPPVPTAAPTLATIELGNSGRSGRGRVTVELGRRLEIDPDAQGRLHLWGNARPEEILVCYHEGQRVGFDGDGERLRLELPEGSEPERRTVKLDGEPVQKIDGAELPPDQVRAVLELRVHVVDDQGEEREWSVDLAMRVGVEKLPGLNWLCIDFGTSAIAASVGRSDGDVFRTLDLQNVEIWEGESFASQDEINLERGTPFLPSWITCDGDLRLVSAETAEDGWPAGFPLHTPSSLALEEPSFVSLPALRTHLIHRPGRLIFSLKQWLACLSSEIRMGEFVTYRAGGRETRSRRLPFDSVLEATIAALTDCYLAKIPHLEVDQVVLTHPNTFTVHHRERFHRLASTVLQQRLGIASANHVTLLSESDAVAFAYCNESLAAKSFHGEVERILVYDFGAGTLDLSLIRLQWREDRRQPKSWTVEGRLGLPRASNHLDELLMRIIDEELRKEDLLAGSGMEYLFPVVAARAEPGREEEHRDAVLETWSQLREVKHAWDGEAPFDVTVGRAEGGVDGIVFRKEKGIVNLPDRPAPGETSLFQSDDNEVRISIPAASIYSSPELREFLDFVVDEAIGELLRAANKSASEVDTLIISGRGSQWPGLEPRVEGALPAATSVKRRDSLERKDVVSRGAIAFQALRHRLCVEFNDHARPRLGLVLGQRHFIPEEEWADGQPVDLSGFDEFRVVQTPLRQAGCAGNLSDRDRLFLVDLAEGPIRTATLWEADPRLFIELTQSQERLKVTLRNSQDQCVELRGSGVSAGVPDLPWPMGHYLLEPQS